MNAATLHRATLLAAGLCLSASGQTAEYFALPNNFQPNNISGDGTTVVGMVGRNDGPAVWTIAGGLTVLRGPGGASIRGGAWAVSADGSVVVGTVLYNGHQVPFRWTAAEGMNVLAPQGFSSAGNGYGVSADGEIACGQGGLNSSAAGKQLDGNAALLRPGEGQGGEVASQRIRRGQCAPPVVLQPLEHRVEDLVRLRVAVPVGLLLVHEFVVNRDVEDALVPGHQRDRPHVLAVVRHDLVRHPGGSRPVVSLDAEFDFDPQLAVV